MIQSIVIHNFKNIEDLQIPQFKRVNLIVGKNSVGKSTILEALAIYISGGDKNVLCSILNNRGLDLRGWKEDVEKNKECLLSLFRNREENYSRDYGILIGENLQQAVTLRQVYYDKVYDEAGGSIPRVRVFYEEDLDSTSVRDIPTGGVAVASPKSGYLIRYERSLMPKELKEECPIVRTWEFNHARDAMMFDNVSLSPNEHYIIQALNLINPDIERISFVAENSNGGRRWPMVSLQSSQRRVRLSTMGEGVNHILSIVLSLLNAENNVLLIDEFETGLHYSVQEKLWDIIFMLAEILNTQVFVTTHSSDCIKSFSQANAKEQGMLIRLENRLNGVTPICYTDNKDILFAAENSIELR